MRVRKLLVGYTIVGGKPISIVNIPDVAEILKRELSIAEICSNQTITIDIPKIELIYSDKECTINWNNITLKHQEQE
jgi:hypothetical protein